MLRIIFLKSLKFIIFVHRQVFQDGRVLGAGGVLRLGGAHLGGYGESDIAYAYRQVPDLSYCPMGQKSGILLTSWYEIWFFPRF